MKILITILLFYQLCFCLKKDIRTETVRKNSLNYSNPQLTISDGEALLNEGDIVVRLGQDPSSMLIKNFNRHDKSYSHAGLVFYENGYPYVFHISTGEETDDESIRKDSLSQFCNPKRNTAFGIFRYNLSIDEVKELKSLIRQWKLKKVQFDSTFNLTSNNKMYCSEMIMKALLKVTRNRIAIETTKLTNVESNIFSAYSHLPISYTKNLEIVSIDNLYTNPSCHLVKRIYLHKLP